MKRKVEIVGTRVEGRVLVIFYDIYKGRGVGDTGYMTIPLEELIEKTPDKIFKEFKKYVKDAIVKGLELEGRSFVIEVSD